jgi:hypothetical protein
MDPCTCWQLWGALLPCAATSLCCLQAGVCPAGCCVLRPALLRPRQAVCQQSGWPVALKVYNLGTLGTYLQHQVHARAARPALRCPGALFCSRAAHVAARVSLPVARPMHLPRPFQIFREVDVHMRLAHPHVVALHAVFKVRARGPTAHDRPDAPRQQCTARKAAPAVPEW